MRARIFFLLLAAMLAWPAAKRITGSGRGENQDLILHVTVYGDAESVKEILGDDLGGHFILADVKIEPKYGKEIEIDRDDFLLRTDHNGERTRPMAPSQIAGTGGLIVTRTTDGVGEGSEPKRGWSIGGFGMGGGGAATKGPENTGVKAADDKPAEPGNPLKQLLARKALAEGKLEKPVAGLLYFPMEGQKLKDLELIYGAKETRISIRFK